MPEQRFPMAYYQKSADFLLGRASLRPRVALVLGSCLGDIADAIEDAQAVPYRDIPNFLDATVDSHAGKLIFGRLAGCDVVCLSGRFHYYEGYDFEELSIPVRVLRLLGVKILLLTNASGAVNEAYAPGDIMLIRDHINIYGASPTRGPNLSEFGPRFFDICNMYTESLQEVARCAARRAGVSLREGVYFYYPGPHFETPAEIRAFRLLGGDAVGMSTVTEALTAAHCGMQVMGLSLIANKAAGMAGPVATEEVNKTARAASALFQRLTLEIVSDLKDE